MVIRQDHGPVTRLILNRPDAMNALDPDLLGELDVHVRSVADDPTVRVVVITATGRAFCAGADLKAVLGAEGVLDAARMLGFERQARATFARVAALTKPTIAVLNGITMAGGPGARTAL
ncbi:enoyl-CoA hydratase/isomerase family protein [Nocardioides sp. B-3]|uniref:enoyl-CoA hydratase/isomerase family protein n=1 Tax=Nocardioides sp. B-3 TaxID=2895565 RepID=UPI0021528E4D|nr:enoyl-CoA hydratase/isomerase family protein [Nocardioides sp. B-3]UUZ59528.1 enoyl-CoA hydratase/isomerase family protein [Nocardioides sp. B-3]